MGAGGQRLVAALPMYDWPERREDVDRFWFAIRDHLRGLGINAPDHVARRNADLPAIPGGIRDGQGNLIAPDPATLEPDAFDLPVVWRHPGLIFGQTCWGPMETGLSDHVSVIGQPDYSGGEGGNGPFYSSAIIINRRNPDAPAIDCPAPVDGRPMIPLRLLAGRRFAFNEPASRSGYRALAADLAGLGKGMEMFSETVETGGHRLSIRAVAEGRADCATIDSRSLLFARQFEPATSEIRVAGWTARRLGLPYIQSLATRHLTDGANAWAKAPLDLAHSDGSAEE